MYVSGAQGPIPSAGVSGYLAFSVDRTLIGVLGSREKATIVLSLDQSIETRELGVAILFIYSRMLGQSEIAVRLLRGAHAATYVVADIPPNATLWQAYSSCNVIACTPGAKIDVVLREGADAYEQHRLELSIGHGRAGQQLCLAFNTSHIALVTARDFLEKIGIVLDGRKTMQQTCCGDLELVTATSSASTADFTQPIGKKRYEFVLDTFLRIASQYPAAPAVSDGERVDTYEQLSGVVSHIACQLAAAGIQRSDIVALSGFASMLAVMASGGASLRSIRPYLRSDGGSLRRSARRACGSKSAQQGQRQANKPSLRRTGRRATKSSACRTSQCPANPSTGTHPPMCSSPAAAPACPIESSTGCSEAWSGFCSEGYHRNAPSDVI